VTTSPIPSSEQTAFAAARFERRALADGGLGERRFDRARQDDGTAATMRGLSTGMWRKF
jgi:hypothetical protein